MATDLLTAANIASLAYETDRLSVGQVVLSSYEVIAVQTETSSGFEAVALIGPKGNLVVAFAGTDPTNFVTGAKDFYQDLKLGTLDPFPSQAEEAIRFTLQAQSAALDYYSGQVENGVLGQCGTVEAIGHSLGGYLAEQVVFAWGGLISGIGFNAPGLGGLVLGFFEAIGAPMIGDLPFVYVESAQQNGWGWIPASGFKISNNVVKVAGAVGHFIGPIIDALEAMGEYYDDRIIRQSNGYEGSTHSATGATNLGGALADKRLGWSERNLGGQLADDRREGGSSASGHVLDSAGSGVASGAMKGVGSALGQGAASTVAYQDRIQRVANGYEGVNATFSYPYYDDAIIRKANGYEGANVTWSDPAKSSATVTREQVNKVLVNANPYKIGYGNGIGPDSRTSWTDTDGHSHWGSVAEYNRAVERGEVDHGSKSEQQERYNQAQPHGGQHETGGLTNTPGTVSGTNNQTSNDPDTSPVSPVLLDLDGNGVKITEFGNSTQFMTGKDGLQHRSSWAGAGDGVLFYDPDGRNAITEARQYVFTEWAPTAQGDLEAIRQVWDTNGDGKLTAADAEFAKFKVMVTGADGQTSVKTLTELGITEIDLTANATRMELPDGSMITGQTTYQRANGTTGTVANTTLVTDTAGYRVVEVVGTDGVNRVVTQTGYGGMRLAA